MEIRDLWDSCESADWDQALQQYWMFVRPGNLVLEKQLDVLNIQRLQELSPQGWFDFLKDEYFRWKYTAPNRYATTTIQLKKYLDPGQLEELDDIRSKILNFDRSDIRLGLTIAKKIRGLGTAGASGLLALIYPSSFATVDQFVVKALRMVGNLPDADALSRMNPQNLTVSDGALLIDILTRKARELNCLFKTTTWTPRKIDMVLWTYGR